VQLVKEPYIKYPAAGLHKAAGLRSALSAGAIAALLCFIPLGFLLGLPLAGFLAVLFYRRRTWPADPSRSAGFRLGARAGAFAFAILAVVRTIDILVSHNADELRQKMIEQMQRTQANDPAKAKQMLDFLTSSSGLTILLIFGAIVCAIFVLLSGLGGAISAGLLRRRPPQS
jgi:hypothetical protein